MSASVLFDLIDREAREIASKIDHTALERKTIMVTGAGGFLGSLFFASAVRAAADVSGVKIVAVVRSESADYLKPYIENERVSLCAGDLSDRSFCDSLPRADLIIHAAGSAEPAVFMGEGDTVLKINTVATVVLLEKLNAGGSFLFISSSDLYNGLQAALFSEEQIGTTNTDHPRACYIEGKRTGETLCHLARKRGVHATAVRLSVTYGPGLKAGDRRVIPSLIEKSFAGRIRLLDRGEGRRSFCYITDALEMMWYVLLYGQHTVYNVGGKADVSVRDVAETIGRIRGVAVVLPPTDAAIAGAPHSGCLDLTRVLTEYRKEDFVGLEEGLRRTVEWYANIREG